MTILLLINVVFLILVHNLIHESDIGNTTPEDFSLIIGNIPYGFEDTVLHKSSYLTINGITPTEVNITYKISEYFEIEQNLAKIRQSLKKLEKLKKTQSVRSSILTRCSNYDKLRQTYNTLLIKAKDCMEKTNKLSPETFSGVVIATFNTIEEADTYSSYFSQSCVKHLINKVYAIIVQFLCFFRKSGNKDIPENRLNLVVKKAPEPCDVIWENLEFKESERNKRKIAVYLISFLLVIVSFSFIVGLNYIQKSVISTDDPGQRYGLSVGISLIIFIINTFIKKVLFNLTLQEREVSLTLLHLNYSIKLTLIVFLNNTMIPVVTSIANNYWDDKEILINNIFLIFVSNAYLNPLIWLLNINKCTLKMQRRTLAKKLTNKSKKMTQREANK